MNILQSKISLPNLPKSWVKRQLDIEGPVLFLQAPAGYGKSTQVRALLPLDGQDTLWYSLDDNDNDPATLLAYLATAIARIVDLPENLLSDCQQRYATHHSVTLNALLRHFLNAAQHTRFYCVFDDMHLLQSPESTQLLYSFFDNIAEHCQLFITSRQPLDAAYARWFLSNRMIKIDQSQLRFSPDEVQRFFSSQQQSLNADELAFIETLFEGWPAGLQLMLLSQRSPSHFAQQLNQAPSLTFDYLYHEVFRHFDTQLQHFLCLSALVDQFNGELSQTLTGYNSEQVRQCIQKLLQRNAFIIPLGHADPWYRYHHLLTHFLRHQAEQHFSPAQRQACHCAASDWYLAQGYLEGACEQAVYSQHRPQITKVLHQIGWHLYNHGQVKQLGICFSALGIEGICQDVEVTLMGVWFYKVMQRDYNMVRRLIEQAGQVYPALLGDTIWRQHQISRYNLIIGHLEAEFGGYASAIDAAKAAYAFFSDPNDKGRALAYSVHSLGLSRKGELTQALACSKQAEMIDWRERQPVGVLWHQCMQASILHQLGQLSCAQTLLTQATQAISQPSIAYIPKLDFLCNTKALIAYEQLQFAKAMEFAQQAIQYCAPWPPMQLPHVSVKLATATRLHDAKNRDSALQQGQDLLSSVVIADDHVADFCIAALNAYHQTGQLLPDWLIYQLNKPSHADCLWISVRQDYAKALYAFLYLDKRHALQCIQPLLTRVEHSEFHLFTLRVQLLLTLWQFQHQKEQAHTSLQNCGEQILKLKAYSVLVERQMQWQTLLIDKAQLSPKVQRLVQKHIHPSEADSQSPHPHELTQREWEILQALDTQLSNERIAEQFFISVNTLKKHLKNIYRKLGVTERKEAIERRKGLEPSS